MTAWSANVSNSAICGSVNGRTSSRHDDDGADRVALPEQRHAIRWSVPPVSLDASDAPELVKLSADVVDVDRPPFEHGAPRIVSRRWPISAGVPETLHRGSVRAQRSRNDSTVEPLMIDALRSTSHSRAAFAATVSSTVWRSVGDEAITRSTSAVAVCCSSASACARELGCARSSSSNSRRSRWR